ncbi:unnamed protein product, partial [marine sediment metagenome]
MTITNLRIVSVEPSIVGPEEIFEVVIAFEYSLEEATSFLISISIGIQRPLTPDTIEFSDSREVQLLVGEDTHTEIFTFQLPASGLTDGGRFIEVTIPDGIWTRWVKEYNAVTFIGYVTPL